MGSFNTTCAVSNVQIRPGDKVRLFFLVSNSYVSDSDGLERHSISNGCQCYPHDDFKIIGGMSIPAEYADYNQYEFDQESAVAKFIFKEIKSHYKENVPVEGVRYNEYHDHMSISKDSLTWEKIQDMIHSGRLFFNPIHGKKYPFVAFYAVHEAVYNLVKPVSVREYNHKISEYQIQTVETYAQDFIKKYGNANSVQQKEEAKLKLLEQFADKISAIEKDSEEYKVLMDMIDSVADLKLFDDGFGNDNYRYNHSYLNTLAVDKYASAVKRGKLHPQMNEDVEDEDLERDVNVDDEIIEQLSLAYAETMFYNIGMYNQNLMYRPVMTSGQEYQVDDKLAFIKKLGVVLEPLLENDYDETLPTELVRHEPYRVLTLKVIRDNFSEWFEGDEEVEKELDLLELAIHNSDGKLVVNSEDWMNFGELYPYLYDNVKRDHSLHITL